METISTCGLKNPTSFGIREDMGRFYKVSLILPQLFGGEFKFL